MAKRKESGSYQAVSSVEDYFAPAITTASKKPGRLSPEQKVRKAARAVEGSIHPAEFRKNDPVLIGKVATRWFGRGERREAAKEVLQETREARKNIHVMSPRPTRSGTAEHWRTVARRTAGVVGFAAVALVATDNTPSLPNAFNAPRVAVAESFLPDEFVVLPNIEQPVGPPSAVEILPPANQEPVQP